LGWSPEDENAFLKVGGCPCDGQHHQGTHDTVQVWLP
jgi:hypothetical protein